MNEKLINLMIIKKLKKTNRNIFLYQSKIKWEKTNQTCYITRVSKLCKSNKHTLMG